jgi:hypothetical protein
LVYTDSAVATVLFGAQDEQSQWSPLFEIINPKQESKFHFDFPACVRITYKVLSKETQFLFI